MDLREEFGTNLREARQEARLSQDELAARTGFHRTELSLIERGGREPRLGTMLKICSALAVPPERLCSGIAWDDKSRRFIVESQGSDA
jgi:transcriptional regulator with XRE-family HTH domain